VAGCCEYGDGPSGSGAAVLVITEFMRIRPKMDPFLSHMNPDHHKLTTC
jgi:hypothetical protein